MNIKSIRKRLFQRPDIGYVRQNSKLDLTVIGTNELATFVRDECGSNLAPFICSNRYILEIGIAGRETASGRCRQRIRGMNAAGVRIDELR